MKKQITREEAEQKLAEIGHHANVSVPVKVKQEYIDTEGILVTHEQKTVLNNAICYNPWHSKQIGSSSNAENAKTAMNFIKGEFTIYSSVFSSYSGDYILID